MLKAIILGIAILSSNAGFSAENNVIEITRIQDVFEQNGHYYIKALGEDVTAIQVPRSVPSDFDRFTIVLRHINNAGAQKRLLRECITQIEDAIASGGPFITISLEAKRGRNASNFYGSSASVAMNVHRAVSCTATD